MNIRERVHSHSAGSLIKWEPRNRSISKTNRMYILQITLRSWKRATEMLLVDAFFEQVGTCLQYSVLPMLLVGRHILNLFQKPTLACTVLSSQLKSVDAKCFVNDRSIKSIRGIQQLFKFLVLSFPCFQELDCFGTCTLPCRNEKFEYCPTLLGKVLYGFRAVSIRYQTLEIISASL